MLRLLVIASLLLAAVAWVEPHWSPDTRTFSLRLRTPAEVARWIAEVAGPVEERWSELVGAPPPRARPDVAAGARAPERSDEQLTDADRARLDRLIEEKTRER